jgi:hypothetical protein
MLISDKSVDRLLRLTVRVVLMRDQAEQVDDVDETDFNTRHVLLEQSRSGESFGRDDVTDTAHDNIGVLGSERPSARRAFVATPLANLTSLG